MIPPGRLKKSPSASAASAPLGVLSLRNSSSLKFTLILNGTDEVQTDAAAAVAKSTLSAVAKFRPHHMLLSLWTPIAALAAVVPPMISI